MLHKDGPAFHRVLPLLAAYLQLLFPVSHEAEILMEILRHGAQVEVLEPKWLRGRVKKEIKKITKNIAHRTLYVGGSVVMSINYQERYVVLDVKTTGLSPWMAPAWWPESGWRWRG